jgi:hypothetical protein
MWVENQKKSYLKTDGSTKQLKSVLVFLWKCSCPDVLNFRNEKDCQI